MFACFDRAAQAEDGELAVIEWSDGIVRPRARHFGEWLDQIADAREEALSAAADIPDNLRDLLIALGFNFDDPIVGRMETGDTEAIEALLGQARTREVRADVDARHLCISTVAMACFPYTDEAFLDAVWSLDPQAPAFIEERKREIVLTVMARIAP